MNDLGRREFLRKAFQIGGIAAIHRFGLGAVKDAQAWNILPVIPTMGAAGGMQEYSAWDELLENVNVGLCIQATNTSPGGNETGVSGRGLLSGADLVATQAGNVPGSDGTKRLLNGVDQRFTLTANALATLLTGTEWTIIGKFTTMNPVDSDGMFWQFYDSAPINIISATASVGDLSVNLDDDDEADATVTPTTNLAPSTAYYIAVWTSAIDGFTRCGYSTTLPTKWSDFTSPTTGGQFAAVYDGFSAFDDRQFIGSTTASFMNVYWHWIILDNTCLIDNAA